MFVASCPECGDAVTVPSQARLSSRVRCPLCTAEFVLQDMLAKMPPVLELIDEPVGYASHPANEYAAAVGGGGNVATMVGTDFDDMALVDAEPRTVRPTYDGPVASGPIGTPTRPPGTSRKKAKRNPVVEIIKIVGGGLLAIPIAQLIAWWAFPKDKGDPAGLGPVITQKAPFLKFLVHPHYHHSSLKQQNPPADGNTAPQNNKPANDNKPVTPPVKKPTTDNSDDPLGDKLGNGSQPMLDPIPEKPMPAKPEPAPGEVELDDPLGGVDNTPKPKVEPEKKPPTKKPAETEDPFDTPAPGSTQP